MDLYDLMKHDGPQFSDLITQITLPALFGIIYLNFMPNNKGKFGIPFSSIFTPPFLCVGIIYS